MPGRNYNGGGSFHHQNGTMTRSIGFIHSNRAYPFLQSRDMRDAKGRKLNSYLSEDDNFPLFREQLAKIGLQLRDIPADGNCLFRALGDQLEGHCRNHFKHRIEVVNFMKSHRHDFEPFVEDDKTFDEHVNAIQKLGTHAGNDAIVAFAKLHNVNVIIHQLNGRPIMIQGPTTNSGDIQQIHLSYHNGDHYSSVRRMDDNTESPAHVCLQDLESDMRNNHEKIDCGSVGEVVRAKRGLEDIQTEVSMATNCRDMARVRQVLLRYDYDVDASIADLLKHMELNRTTPQDENASLASQRTYTTDNEVLHSSATNSNCSSPNFNSSRVMGSVLKTNGHSYANGKGHKVHFREDSVGSSSGYESLKSYNGGGARPKVIPPQQFYQRTLRESRKMGDKKRLAEERRQRENGVEEHHYVPQVTGVRDVAVVGLHNGRVTRRENSVEEHHYVPQVTGVRDVAVVGLHKERVTKRENGIEEHHYVPKVTVVRDVGLHNVRVTRRENSVEEHHYIPKVAVVRDVGDVGFHNGRVARRENGVEEHHYIPKVTGVRDVTVVGLHNGKVTRL